MDVSNEDSTCFVGICKLVTPLYIKDISITDKTPGEFAIRLSLEGKFVYVDGKSSSSLGYSSLELLGKSYFEYIHVDDLDKIEDSFGKLNQCGEIQAPMYRLMTKGRQWLVLRNHKYLSKKFLIFFITFFQGYGCSHDCTFNIISGVVKQNQSM